jgi:hypothetical protein
VIGDDDLVYFGDNTGEMHAVTFHGRAPWTVNVGSPVRSASTILAPERLAFGLDKWNEVLESTLPIAACVSDHSVDVEARRESLRK